MIQRCNNCARPFFPSKSKLDSFCSIACKHSFEDKEVDDEGWLEKQEAMDFKAKQADIRRDNRLKRH